MRKEVITGFFVVAILTIASAVYAHSPGKQDGFSENICLYAQRISPHKYHKKKVHLIDYKIAKRWRMHQKWRKHKIHRYEKTRLQEKMLDSRSMIHKKYHNAGMYYSSNGVRRQVEQSVLVLAPRCQRTTGL